MGTDWGKQTVAFSGYGLPMQADIGVNEMMLAGQAANPERRDLLLSLLQIDPKWRMHQVSDGQRRRVQIFLQLLSPFPVVLLDEITVDLDVITRADFLDFLKAESEAGKVTVMYATHIFSGLESWFTHIAYISEGRLLRFGTPEELVDFQALVKAGDPSPLHKCIELWIRADRAVISKRKAAMKSAEAVAAAEASAVAVSAAGGAGGLGVSE